MRKQTHKKLFSSLKQAKESSPKANHCISSKPGSPFCRGKSPLGKKRLKWERGSEGPSSDSYLAEIAIWQKAEVMIMDRGGGWVNTVWVGK